MRSDIEAGPTAESSTGTRRLPKMASAALKAVKLPSAKRLNDPKGRMGSCVMVATKPKVIHVCIGTWTYCNIE
jgi:hypothetical protein